MEEKKDQSGPKVWVPEIYLVITGVQRSKSRVEIVLIIMCIFFFYSTPCSQTSSKCWIMIRKGETQLYAPYSEITTSNGRYYTDIGRNLIWRLLWNPLGDPWTIVSFEVVWCDCAPYTRRYGSVRSGLAQCTIQKQLLISGSMGWTVARAWGL